MPPEVRALLVEDHAVVRSSLALLLSSHGIVVVGEAADGEQAVVEALRLRPDIIIMDITLPDLDGVEATRRICQEWPQARVLALTMHGEEAYLLSFLEAGGAGYVTKSSVDREVVEAIRRVLAGETYVQAQGMQWLVRRHRSPATLATEPGPEVLSERERSVLEHTARGFTSREIGERLGISPHTVDSYRTRIMEKLGLKQRHQLVEYALRHRLLD